MPTIKQKVAYKEVVKGSTITKAMRTAGYSKETSKRTNKLVNTKGFQELIEKYLSDSKLAKVHADGLKATKPIIIKNKREDTEDYAVRHKYLETAYKLKGLLTQQDQAPNILQNIALFIRNRESLETPLHIEHREIDVDS